MLARWILRADNAVTASLETMGFADGQQGVSVDLAQSPRDGADRWEGLGQLECDEARCLVIGPMKEVRSELKRGGTVVVICVHHNELTRHRASGRQYGVGGAPGLVSGRPQVILSHQVEAIE